MFGVCGGTLRPHHPHHEMVSGGAELRELMNPARRPRGVAAQSLTDDRGLASGSAEAVGFTGGAVCVAFPTQVNGCCAS